MDTKKIVLFDTTLRDGAQTRGVHFSVEDKIKLTRELDEMGFDYIEGGGLDPIQRISSSSMRCERFR